MVHRSGLWRKTRRALHLLASTSGRSTSSRLPSASRVQAPLVGEPFTILAFVTVILGGLGNVVGALVGGLVIGLVYEIGGLLLPGQDKLLLVFIVFVLVLLARPQGLFVKEHR